MPMSHKKDARRIWVNRLNSSLVLMRGSKMFCQRGSNSDKVALVDEGSDDQNTSKSRLAQH